MSESEVFEGVQEKEEEWRGGSGGRGGEGSGRERRDGRLQRG